MKRAQKILEIIFRRSVEWIYFVMAVIVIFNVLTQFLQTVGIVKTFTVVSLKYYGLLSIMLAMNNFLSHKFFGLELFKN